MLDKWTIEETDFVINRISALINKQLKKLVNLTMKHMHGLDQRGH